MRNYRVAGAVSLLALCACGGQAGGPLPGASGGTTSVGSGGGAAAGSGGSGTPGPIASGGSNSTIDLDPSGGSVGVGNAPGVGTNGGYIDLTAEQAADIKESQCAGQTVGVEPVPAVLEFVIDVSESMGQDITGQNIPADSELQSKWEITQPALQAALDGLGDDVYVGITFYPSHDPPGNLGDDPNPVCVDESTTYPIALMGAAGSEHRTLLSTAVTTMDLSYGTPTHDAYVYALENGLGAFTEAGDKVMILVTDGAPAQLLGCGTLEPNGVDPQPIIDEIAGAAAEGVTTFVIGSPGSQTSMSTPPMDLRPWLSDAAIAGGTAPDGCSSAGPNFCHFDMTTAPDFGTALTAALAEIGTAVAQTCTFAAPDSTAGAPLDLETTTVILTKPDQTSTLILPDADADCSDGGWTRGPANEVILCPSTCELFQAGLGSEVSLSVGCEIIIK
jgi:hypothetical protein